MSSLSIKRERSESPEGFPEGLLPEIEISVPAGFEREQWLKLTEGFASELDEVRHVISQRGHSGSKKGRPTNYRVPFKGELSNSARAIQQRDRTALRSEEETALENAKSSDRSAKYQLKSKLTKSKEHTSLPTNEQDLVLEVELEKLAEKRFRGKSSAEWLTTTLDLVHTKWSKIYHEVDMKAHQLSLEKLSAPDEASPTSQPTSRGIVRLFGSGGALDKILRNVYQDGKAKLESNSFENKEAKDKWLEFVERLTQKELAMVCETQWTQREPSPIFNLNDADSVTLQSNKPYVLGDNSDECEEEVDDDSDIDDYYNQGENEYETEEQHEAIQAELDAVESEDEESEWEGFPDSIGEEEESEWQGFSD